MNVLTRSAIDVIGRGGILEPTRSERRFLLPLSQRLPSIIDRDSWPELVSKEKSGSKLIMQILDQGNTDMCASFATAQMLMTLWVRTWGKRCFILFSPADLYVRITGGRPGGSSIQSNVGLAQEAGILPADTPRNRELLKQLGLNPNHVMAMNDYRAKPPSGADITRKHFRLDEVWAISRWSELVTCSLTDLLAVYGRRMHAILNVVMTYLDDGKLYSKYANSWGEWGDGDDKMAYGFGYDSEGFVSDDLARYGGAAGESMVITDVGVSLARMMK